MKTIIDLRHELEALAAETGPFCLDVDLDEFADRAAPIIDEAALSKDADLRGLALALERKLWRAMDRRDTIPENYYLRPPSDRPRSRHYAG